MGIAVPSWWVCESATISTAMRAARSEAATMVDATNPAPRLPAAAVADASVRLGRPIRLGPAELRRLVPGPPLNGPARPVRHAGSVDAFFEALELAAPGEVMVIDNAGRRDEGCIGDLSGLEIRDAGIAGVVVWGLHRDSRELVEIGLPVWSLGTCPVGPLGARPREADALLRARVGEVVVEPGDIVVADDDGVLFVAAAEWDEIAGAAALIVEVERRQADLARAGQRLRDQYDFGAYLARRAADPAYTFRDYLRTRGAAIEE
jgi:regulator of RNase E activity RraA